MKKIEFCDTVLIKVTVNDEFGGNGDESDYLFTIGEPEPVISKSSEPNCSRIN